MAETRYIVHVPDGNLAEEERLAYAISKAGRLPQIGQEFTASNGDLYRVIAIDQRFVGRRSR